MYIYSAVVGQQMPAPQTTQMPHAPPAIQRMHGLLQRQAIGLCEF